MDKLIILVDNKSEFQLSKPDLKYYRSMEVQRIVHYFAGKGMDVEIHKFHELDTDADFKGVYVIYQSSEAPGSFYKRYIEDLIFHLDKKGAIIIPGFEYLKAHHNKVFMEFLRDRFRDESLKTLKSKCFGSWEDAYDYKPNFPVVIKKASGSGGAGVFLARNMEEYRKFVKKAGKIIISENIAGTFIDKLKKLAKRVIRSFHTERSGFKEYDTSPVSNQLLVQPFVEGLKGDYKVLFFAGKYYLMFRKNRDNDFRASGSGKRFDVPAEEHLGLVMFARKVVDEINFPIIGMDVVFDGSKYHLVEFQMIHPGTSSVQRSKYWYEYRDDKPVMVEGFTDLEEEYSRSIYTLISK